ncbi:MAG: exo-alpha-sialidase [Ignavibacteria bacterium]|nr:exo-alpha-sialidase [Ignavibacteria bacterium]
MKRSLFFAFLCVVIAATLSACSEMSTTPPHGERTPITTDVAWTVIHREPKISLNSIRFDPSGQFGIALSYYDGRGSYTTDKGNSWQPLNLTQWLGQAGSFDFGKPTIADAQTAWLEVSSIQDRRLFLGSTSNGGHSWTFKEFPHSDIFNTSIRSSLSTICVFQRGQLADWGSWSRRREFYISVDGGTSWSQRSLPDYVVDMALVEGRTIVTATASDSTRYAISSLLISTDEGQSWRTVLRDTLWYFHGVFFPTPSAGIVIAARYRTDIDSTRLRQAVFRTLDAGNTWTKTYEFSIPWRDKYYSSIMSAAILFAVPPTWILHIHYSFTGSGGLNIDRYRSDDNGLTWAYLENLRGYYYEPAFAPPDWKVGIRGNQMTQDGGRTWQVKSWLITRAIFPNPYEVFAVKDSLILRGTAP